jgi:hypothetical protein
MPLYLGLLLVVVALRDKVLVQQALCCADQLNGLLRVFREDVQNPVRSAVIAVEPPKTRGRPAYERGLVAPCYKGRLPQAVSGYL